MPTDMTLLKIQRESGAIDRFGATGIVSAFCCLPFKTTSFIRFPSSTTGTLVTIRKCAFDAIKVVGFSL